MTPLPDLARLVAEAAPEELPSLIGALASAQAQALARLTMPANGNGHEPEPATWITPSEAAAIAQVPATRIYAWAQGAKWASRPSRRCLRISEQGFRHWLAERA